MLSSWFVPFFSLLFHPHTHPLHLLFLINSGPISGPLPSPAPLLPVVCPPLPSPAWLIIPLLSMPKPVFRKVFPDASCSLTYLHLHMSAFRAPK